MVVPHKHLKREINKLEHDRFCKDFRMTIYKKGDEIGIICKWCKARRVLPEGFTVEEWQKVWNRHWYIRS